MSNKDQGREGTSDIEILPGSSLDIFCEATGNPHPTIKWVQADAPTIENSRVILFHTEYKTAAQDGMKGIVCRVLTNKTIKSNLR